MHQTKENLTADKTLTAATDAAQETEKQFRTEEIPEEGKTSQPESFLRKERTVRNYKDTIFRMIFKEPKELLALYNAVNDTHYENPDDLEITTLENAVYMNMKNDVSCVLDMQMNLYEHQSTVNPNTPLRNLMYTARLFEKEIAGKDVYSRKQIMLPTPKFITFYNGVEPQPERKVMRLSDSFAKKEGW